MPLAKDAMRSVSQSICQNGDRPVESIAAVAFSPPRIAALSLANRHGFHSDSIGSPGNPPCKRCIEEQRECVLATSRRGGRRVRKKKIPELDDDGVPLLPQHGGHPVQASRQNMAMDSWQATAAADNSWVDESAASRTDPSQPASRRSSVALEGHLASNDLLNPSDALDLLAQVADLDPSRHPRQGDGTGQNNGSRPSASSRYPPISDGALGYANANTLVQ